jgi:NAD(P)H-hydrate epimerase
MAAKLTECMTLAVTSLDDLAARVSDFSALAIGPGIGTSDATMRAVANLLGGLSIPAVVDADALPAVKGLSVGAAPLVLTPHPGEMARLLGGGIADVQADRVGAARSAAEAFGAVVVLKGASTIVADPTGGAWIIPTGNPGMASGGMGDVLTGLIGALLAGGLSAAGAAVSGAYLHGLAGDIAAASMGEAGIAAGDVAERLPLARGLVVSADE